MKPPSAKRRKHKLPIVRPTIRPIGTGAGLCDADSAGGDGVDREGDAAVGMDGSGS